jgi:hypothetical protein
MFYVSSVNIESDDTKDDVTTIANGILWVVAMLFSSAALITILV